MKKKMVTCEDEDYEDVVMEVLEDRTKHATCWVEVIAPALNAFNESGFFGLDFDVEEDSSFDEFLAAVAQASYRSAVRCMANSMGMSPQFLEDEIMEEFRYEQGHKAPIEIGDILSLVEHGRRMRYRHKNVVK